MRKESELWQYHCRNSTKVGERKIKSRREKFLIFGNGIAAIPFAHTYYPVGCSKCECAQGKPNDGKKKKLAIVAMPLPKMGGKKKVCSNGIAEIEDINFWQLWQWHCRNRGVKKNFWNCEKWNGIQQCHCHNSIPLFFFF